MQQLCLPIGNFVPSRASWNPAWRRLFSSSQGTFRGVNLIWNTLFLINVRSRVVTYLEHEVERTGYPIWRSFSTIIAVDGHCIYGRTRLHHALAHCHGRAVLAKWKSLPGDISKTLLSAISCGSSLKYSNEQSPMRFRLVYLPWQTMRVLPLHRQSPDSLQRISTTELDRRRSRSHAPMSVFVTIQIISWGPPGRPQAPENIKEQKNWYQGERSVEECMAAKKTSSGQQNCAWQE